MLGDWLGSLDWLELGKSFGNGIGFYYWKVLGTTLGYQDGLSFGTYDDTVLIYSEDSTELITEGNLEGLLLGDWLGYLDGLDLGTDDGNALWFWDGKPLGTSLGALGVLPLVIYGGTELGRSEGSTEGTEYSNLEGMFIGAWQHLEIWMESQLVHMIVQCYYI